MPEKKVLTNVELEFMHIVWEHEPVSTDVIQQQLASRGRDWTDGGIRRILAILRKKGFIKRTKQGRAYLYESVVKYDDAVEVMLDNLRNRLFRGSLPSMIAALLKSDISNDELAYVKKLVDEAEKEDEQ